MPKYHLTCSCGRNLDVDAGQAGETLRCQCGATVAVPTLRQLRELPTARDEVATRSPAGSASAWGIRQGVTAASLIVAVVCLGVAGVSRLTEPSLPRFDPATYGQLVERRFGELTPTTAWRVWIENYRPLASTGFTKFEHPSTAPLQQEINQRRLLQVVMVSIAGVCIVVTIVLGAIKTGRHADKETRRAKMPSSQ